MMADIESAHKGAHTHRVTFLPTFRARRNVRQFLRRAISMTRNNCAITIHLRDNLDDRRRKEWNILAAGACIWSEGR